MAGLDSRFVLVPNLQQYFVDKDTGLPLSNGSITFYQDLNRTQLKPVYMISGAPPNYIYIQLPNPVTLTGVGTVDDGNGNDVLPYFFPYDGTPDNSTGTLELYYAVVKSEGDVEQFTREGLPNIASTSPITQPFINSNNLVVNNIFLNNIGQTANPVPDTVVLAPGAHAGFATTDITFQRSASTATDQITFVEFGQGSDPLLPDATPQYYLNYNCPNVPVGETRKDVEFALQPKVKTLENLTLTFDIWAQGISGTTSLSIRLLQYFGSGGSPSAPIFIPIGSGAISLNSNWTQYTATVTVPSTAGKTIGLCGDDGYYLQIGFPLNASSNINFTKPKLYFGDFVPDSLAFQSNDQIDAIINSNRTGDIKLSLNSVAPYGWVPMNDGSIGSATSAATTRANIDTFFLFKTIWINVPDSLAPVSGGRGISAEADFAANKRLTLTRTAGRALAGVGSGAGLTPRVTGFFTGEETHTQAPNEVGAHTHTGSVVVATTEENGGGGTEFITRGFQNGTNTNFTFPLTINASAAPVAMNNMQPTTFLNIFAKL